MFDAKALGADIVDAVKSHVALFVAPLTERIAKLEGRAPEKGADGIGFKDAMIDTDGFLVLTRTDGEVKRLACVRPDVEALVKEAVQDLPPPPAGADGIDGINGTDGTDGADGVDGKDGKNGADGQDGLGFDDMSMTYDGQRKLSVVFEKGGQSKSFDFDLPVPIYQGVFKRGESYSLGDMATYDGAVWHCNKATKATPGTNNEWRLAAKSGRNGKDGEKGERGLQGPRGQDYAAIRGKS